MWLGWETVVCFCPLWTDGECSLHTFTMRTVVVVTKSQRNLIRKMATNTYMCGICSSLYCTNGTKWQEHIQGAIRRGCDSSVTECRHKIHGIHSKQVLGINENTSCKLAIQFRSFESMFVRLAFIYSVYLILSFSVIPFNQFPNVQYVFLIVVAFAPAIAIQLQTVLHFHDLKYLWCFDVLHSIVQWRLWTAFVLCEQPPLHLLIADSVLFSSSPQKLN